MRKIIIALVAMFAVATPVAVAGSASATTGPQRQAIGRAQEYLRFESFSKAGLSGQLQFEGFSRATSDYAVSHIRVSWMNQAVKKAHEYLRFTHFSCSGLIGQLRFEKFTPRQASFGAHHTSAC